MSYVDGWEIEDWKARVAALEAEVERLRTALDVMETRTETVIDFLASECAEKIADPWAHDAEWWKIVGFGVADYPDAATEEEKP